MLPKSKTWIEITEVENYLLSKKKFTSSDFIYESFLSAQSGYLIFSK